ncbi:MAG: two-component system sensor histidine kinase CreC [Alcanivorax sp.]|uniref:histidine kinase n=1 Tax=Alloalcanivorax marinus TaxID=1177169 RepID=A0A9Q3URK0_9GAMM|nr:two-component system sensor histidine kinase CreC [Alloalcanivorax marinus]MCC4309748.1 two-component system sensor histidine kinase CreC [Alloalcanivorax marinus]MCU5786019.1 sensory histidine kinase CreC [Alloalcanivorax marinus]
MKLSRQLLLIFFLVMGLVSWFIMDLVLGEAKPLVRQSAEETLVDAANLLAEIIASDARDQRLTITPDLRAALQRYAERAPAATIWGLDKNRTDTHVYVTDARGVVRFDSQGLNEGEDFSRWNDVLLTLQGKYGARTTRSDPDDPTSSVLYVAAPVRHEGTLIGVVTLGKPGASIQPFVAQAEARLIRYGWMALAVCLLLGVGLAWWISRRVGRLRAYALAVAEGGRPAPPRFRVRDEIHDLARAVTAMRRGLEERSRLENHTAMLTHEMKSPLAAIRGAGEILAEEVADPALHRLTDNVVHESQRLSDLLDRMLALARLEKLESLPPRRDQGLAPLLDEWRRSRQVLLDEKTLTVALEGEVVLRVDPDTARLALFNLLDNGLRFADPVSTLVVAGWRHGDTGGVTVTNHGPRIPDYALDRVSERFYSLPAPGHEKSSGLGLAMVREVAELHGGWLRVENLDDGVRVTLCLG